MVGLGSIIRLRSGCIITEDGLSMKLKDKDIPNISSFSFIYRFEFYKLPTYPIIRLYFEIFDHPEKDPIKGEVVMGQLLGEKYNFLSLAKHAKTAKKNYKSP